MKVQSSSLFANGLQDKFKGRLFITRTALLQVGFIGGYKFQVEAGVPDLSSYDRFF